MAARTFARRLVAIVPTGQALILGFAVVSLVAAWLGLIRTVPPVIIAVAVTGLVLVGAVARRRQVVAARQRSHEAPEPTVEQRTKELQRRQDHERLGLATAVDAIGEGIMITDAQAIVRYVNPAFEQITGYRRDEVIGNNPRLLQSGQHDAGFYRRMWQTISRGQVWRGSFVDRKKHGALYDVDSTIAPIREGDGRPIGYVAVSRDVTDRNRAERALRDSEARIRTIVETAAEGILTTDENGSVESCNRAASEIFGYGADEMVGRPVTVLLPAFWSATGASPASSRPLSCSLAETEGRRRDGSTFPLDLSLSEVALGERNLITVMLRDATDRHARLAAERSLCLTEQELRVARSIQQGFFPYQPPDAPGFEIAGASCPAEHTGGDYFDYLPMDHGCVGVVVGDVSGHGIGPALVMSQTRAYLRALITFTDDIGELLTRLNGFLVGDCSPERFVTLVLVQLDPTDHSFSYASAGHRSFLLHTDGSATSLPATGIPLGILSREIPHGPRLKLEPGELILLLSDGIEESEDQDGVELGTERILRYAHEHRHLPAGDIVEGLFAAARKHRKGAPQLDDITAVVVKSLPLQLDS